MVEITAQVDSSSSSALGRTRNGPARLRVKTNGYGAAGALAVIDGRSKEAVFLRRRRAELASHVAPGGRPTATQAMLIDRCCWLSLRLAMLDAKLAAGELTENDGRCYMTWSNAFGRSLKLLGLKATTPAPPSLADIAARIARDGPTA